MPTPVSESPPKEPATADAPPTDFPLSAELKRKALHVLALALPTGMILLGKPAVLFALVPLALAALGADALRAHSPTFSRWIRRIFGPLMRPDEWSNPGDLITINGATWVIVSATLLAVVFPVHIAAPTLAMFVLADAVAALVGRRWGRTPWGIEGHTLEGSAAFLATGLLVMTVLPTSLFWTGTAGVVVACLAEIAPLPLNDNVHAPFAAATAIALLEWLVLGHSVPLFV